MTSSSFVVVHQNPYKLTLDEKVKWVQELIDESGVVWNASSGGHANVVDLLLNVNNVNVNVVMNECTALYVASDNGHLNAAKANEMLLHHIETKISLFIGPASALALASARAMFQFRASAKEDYPQECAEYEAMREERVSSKKRGVAWCGDFVVCVFCCSVDVVVVLYIC